MKILLIPLDFHRNNEDSLLFGDLIRSFSNHGTTMLFTNIGDGIDFQPDLIFYQGSLSHEECLLLKKNTVSTWTTWTGDVRYAPIDYLMRCREFTDIFFVPFTGELLRTYESLLGKSCKYIYEPLHNCRIIKPKEINEGKITFVGNVYDTLPGGEERIELNNFFVGKVGLVDFGNNVNVKSVPQLYNDSFAVIAQNNWSDIEGYFTPRNLLAMANSLCLAKRYPGCEKYNEPYGDWAVSLQYKNPPVFKNWEHCIYYKHKYELLDIINFIRAYPEFRNKIAKQGYEYVVKNYTYDSWSKLYIDMI
jgi:hypothetical protein